MSKTRAEASAKLTQALIDIRAQSQANDDLVGALAILYAALDTPNYVGKHVLPKPNTRMYRVTVLHEGNTPVRFNYRKDDGLLIVKSQGPWPFGTVNLPDGCDCASPQWLAVLVPDFKDVPLYLHANDVLAVEST